MVPASLCQRKICPCKSFHSVDCQVLAFEMTGGRHCDTDMLLNDLFRKTAQIGRPLLYAMSLLHALRRECSLICARIVGQQAERAPCSFKHSPRRPLNR